MYTVKRKENDYVKNIAKFFQSNPVRSVIDGKLRDNGSGGGIDNGGTLTLSGGTIRENESSGWGGGVYLRDSANAVFNLNGGTANTAPAACRRELTCSAIYSTKIMSIPPLWLK